MAHYHRPTHQLVESLGVPTETKHLLKRLIQLTDRDVHVSRSATGTVRPVWTFTLAPPFHGMQIAVALNVGKVTVYMKSQNPVGVDVRSKLVQLALIEQQYPNPQSQQPPSFFSVGVAPGLQPDAVNPLLRVVPRVGRALEVLDICLGVAGTSVSASRQPESGVPGPRSPVDRAEAITGLTDQGSIDLHVDRRDAESPSPGLSGVVETDVSEDDESAFPEGVAAYKLHRTFERDSDFIRRVKQARLNAMGKLACEVCRFDFASEYGFLGQGYIEAHHKVPVHRLDGKSSTRAEDIALVCSNCHRMLHRSDPQTTIEELRLRRSSRK